VSLVRSGASKVHTKWSGVLLSVHLACALLAHFASQVRTLSMLRLAPFPSAQVRCKTQHLHPTCALCFLHWNHTCRFCGAFYCQLLLDSDLPIFILPTTIPLPLQSLFFLCHRHPPEVHACSCPPPPTRPGHRQRQRVHQSKGKIFE
jgi:hypothetical protein